MAKVLDSVKLCALVEFYQQAYSTRANKGSYVKNRNGVRSEVTSRSLEVEDKAAIYSRMVDLLGPYTPVGGSYHDWVYPVVKAIQRAEGPYENRVKKGVAYQRHLERLVSIACGGHQGKYSRALQYTEFCQDAKQSKVVHTRQSLRDGAANLSVKSLAIEAVAIGVTNTDEILNLSRPAVEAVVVDAKRDRERDMLSYEILIALQDSPYAKRLDSVRRQQAVDAALKNFVA